MLCYLSLLLVLKTLHMAFFWSGVYICIRLYLEAQEAGSNQPEMQSSIVFHAGYIDFVSIPLLIYVFTLTLSFLSQWFIAFSFLDYDLRDSRWHKQCIQYIHMYTNRPLSLFFSVTMFLINVITSMTGISLEYPKVFTRTPWFNIFSTVRIFKRRGQAEIIVCEWISSNLLRGTHFTRQETTRDFRKSL